MSRRNLTLRLLTLTADSELLGHQRAYPELIYEVAKLAKREEVSELAEKTMIQPT